MNTATKKRPKGEPNLLLVRLDNIGDVLMCTPAMQAIREAHPQARLTLLTSPAAAQLAPHLDMIDAVISCRVPWVRQMADGGADGMPALIWRLGQEKFDAAFIFTTATQSALPMALICLMAGIPLRYAHSRENPYELLTGWCREMDVLGPDMRHEVQRQLDLLNLARIPPPQSARLRFSPRAEDRIAAWGSLKQIGMPAGQPYVVIHPGATAPSRRYSPFGFGLAADGLFKAGWPCVFCGGLNDQTAISTAMGAMEMGGANLCGKLTLGGVGALIEGAHLLVANNSGPAHIAAAVGTPVVCLYAQTNPQHTPWCVPSRVLYQDVPCRNCLRSVCPHEHHACLSGVAPQEVFHAALDLLNRASYFQTAL